MNLSKDEETGEIFTIDISSNPKNFLEKQIYITFLFAQKKHKEASSFLYSVTSGLKNNNQEYKLKLEFHYLCQLAENSIFYVKTAELFREFLMQFKVIAKYKLTSHSYKRTFSAFLIENTRDIGSRLSSQVSKKGYQTAIELYNYATDFLLELNLPHANQLVIKKGDTLCDKGHGERGLKAYKEILLNLYLSSLNSNFCSDDHELHLLKIALDKISSHPKEKNKVVYKSFSNLINAEDIETMSGAFQEIISKTPQTLDYNLYQQLFYIGNILLFLAEREERVLSDGLPELITSTIFRGLLLFLADQICIFKAIDEEHDNINKVQALLTARINLNVCNQDGATPLQYAIIKNEPTIVFLLINEGVYIENDSSNSNGKKLYPPIYLAILTGNKDILQLLIDHDANLNVHPDSDLPSPLYFSMMQKKTEMTKLLLENLAELKPSEINILRREQNPTFDEYKFWMNSNLHFRNMLHLKNPEPVEFSVIQPFTLTANENSFSKTPIFCPHALDGCAYGYRAFANKIKEVDPDRPVYGIYSPAFLGEGEELKSIEESATLYIESLKTIEPTGPYILFGWSFGGLLVYEMARQLEKQGDAVIIAGLFDTLAPAALQKMNQKKYAEHLTNIMEQLSKYWKGTKFQPPSPSELEVLSKEAQVDSVFPPVTAIDTKTDNYELRRRMITHLKTNLLATLKYSPPKDEDSKLFITCFNADQTCREYNSDNLGWDEHVGDKMLATVIPNTNHFDILGNEELVKEIASYISEHSLVLLADLKKEWYWTFSNVLSSCKDINNLRILTILLNRLDMSESEYKLPNLEKLLTEGGTEEKRRLLTKFFEENLSADKKTPRKQDSGEFDLYASPPLLKLNFKLSG